MPPLLTTEFPRLLRGIRSAAWLALPRNQSPSAISERLINIRLAEKCSVDHLQTETEGPCMPSCDKTKPRAYISSSRDNHTLSASAKDVLIGVLQNWTIRDSIESDKDDPTNQRKQ